MGKNSEISWTDHTWNPWQGCKKVSPGCKNCYMFDGQKRWGNDPENIHRSSDRTFNMPLRLKEPCKVFTCSWSDFFLKEADPWRDDAWDIIRRTPQITYQILTKRPENMIDRLPDDWPLKNVWLGVTAENQEQADIRIPILMEIKASVRFVSVEPILEPIDLENIPCPDHLQPLPHSDFRFNALSNDDTNHFYNESPSLDWVICGGESGPNYRPIEEQWIQSLKEDCVNSNTPFFMKQMSAVEPKKKPIPDYLNVKEFPA